MYDFCGPPQPINPTRPSSTESPVPDFTLNPLEPDYVLGAVNPDFYRIPRNPQTPLLAPLLAPMAPIGERGGNWPAHLIKTYDVGGPKQQNDGIDEKKRNHGFLSNGMAATRPSTNSAPNNRDNAIRRLIVASSRHAKSMSPSMLIMRLRQLSLPRRQWW
jgi:hypothetical protein